MNQKILAHARPDVQVQERLVLPNIRDDYLIVFVVLETAQHGNTRRTTQPPETTHHRNYVDRIVANRMSPVRGTDELSNCPAVFPMDPTVCIAHNHKINSRFFDGKKPVEHVDGSSFIRLSNGDSLAHEDIHKPIGYIISNVHKDPPPRKVLANYANILEETFIIEFVVRVVQAEREYIHYTMRTLLLVSGMLRSFRENLKQWPAEYDIAVYASHEEDNNYLNPDTLRFLLDEPRIKLLLVEQPGETNRTNGLKQWYKLWRLWQAVPKTYSKYVRIRPDVCILDPNAFRAAVERSEPLCVPEGGDRDGINDQIAIGTHEAMNGYVSVYSRALETTGKTSEWILAQHLKSVSVCRVHVPYKLVLSRAKVIAIAGDSGSGKSTLCGLIRPLFLFDKVLEYETDRYHKWERGDVHWKTTSHLHPNANHLEKLEDDTFNLKIGNTVLAVDYDHATGTFTSPQPVEPKENILLCGLHTLYTKQLRDLSDLKIYLDTSEQLKVQWKLERDTAVRNQSPEEVLAKIASRREDFRNHVDPQKEHADIIITRDADTLRIEARHREWIPGSGYWDSPDVDVRKDIWAFMASLDLPPIDAYTGYEGVIQLTILRALYTKHG